MASIRFDIDKFDGITNFNLWQVRMTTILIQGDLEKVLTEKKPADMDKEVLMEKTTFTLWKWLETLYVTKSLVNRLMLKQRLYMFCMNEGEHLRDHINQFINLLNDLKNVEVQINDEHHAMLLLCFLPYSYKSFSETLIYGRNNLSFKDVKGHLLSKHKLDNEFSSDNKSDR
ncbi:hypothetical protein Gotur_029296 [Gossypium turneri]